jgi:hypothetical protein
MPASMTGNAIRPFDYTARQDFALVIENVE